MWLEAMGWLGACLVLFAYGFLSMKKLSASGYIYQGMNVVGALILAFYTWQKGAIPSSFLNIVWCFIGVVAVVAAYRANHRNMGK